MSENGKVSGLAEAAQQIVVHELVVRWVPATGQVQFASSIPDEVAQLGLLEMAKMALVEKKIRAITGTEPSRIIPAAGRLVS
jgi:hypothetical protein